jgi:hypothetical protein
VHIDHHDSWPFALGSVEGGSTTYWYFERSLWEFNTARPETLSMEDIMANVVVQRVLGLYKSASHFSLRSATASPHSVGKYNKRVTVIVEPHRDMWAGQQVDLEAILASELNVQDSRSLLADSLHQMHGGAEAHYIRDIWVARLTLKGPACPACDYASDMMT